MHPVRLGVSSEAITSVRILARLPNTLAKMQSQQQNENFYTSPDNLEYILRKIVRPFHINNLNSKIFIVEFNIKANSIEQISYQSLISASFLLFKVINIFVLFTQQGNCILN